jgi:type III pantothenate kinase
MLFADIGNTNIKIARFNNSEEWEIVQRFKADEFLFSKLQAFDDEDLIILSSVHPLLKNREEDLENCLMLTTDHFPPDFINYDTPETLGVDRVLAGFGAFALTGEPTLVIDAGSAITVDHIIHEGKFYGGLIAPGYRALTEGMKKVTPSLPETHTFFSDPPNESERFFPAKSSRESVNTGMEWAFESLVTGLVGRARTRLALNGIEQPRLVVTGGDADRILPLFPDALYDPMLIFEGMKYWFEKYRTNWDFPF